MYGPVSQVRVAMFAVWLSSEAAEVWVRLFGQAAGVLPLARRVLPLVGPWLAGLLAERSRLGPSLGEQDGCGLSGAALAVEPFGPGELPQSAAQVRKLLVEELGRLVWLGEAPNAALVRPGWLAWEGRCWGLAVGLAGLASLWWALEQQVGTAQATRLFQEAGNRVWWQAVGKRQAA